MNMASYYDVTSNVYPVIITTVCRCSKLEFGRGARNQASAPGITRPLRATAQMFAEDILHTLKMALEANAVTLSRRGS